MATSSSIYIAGPMRGFPEYNFPAFNDTAIKLRQGHWADVRNPAERDVALLGQAAWRAAPGWATGDPEGYPEGFNLDAALDWDLRQIEGVRCIYLLPGWRSSAGSGIELAYAARLDKVAIDGVEHAAGNHGMYSAVELFDSQASQWRKRALTALELLRPIGDHDTRIQLAQMMGEINRPLWGLSVLNESDTPERIVVDSATGGAKGTKLARFDLLPYDALTIVAEHYGKGAEKYDERNWERGYNWGLSYAALMRHLAAWWQGEENDPELGNTHLAAAAFHVLTLIAFQQRAIGTDSRTPGTRVIE